MAPILKNETEPVIGYELSVHYNNTFMFDDYERIPPCCQTCGYSLIAFPHRSTYSSKQRSPGLTPRKLDVACTFDSRLIVSSAFRDFCEAFCYEGLEFLNFEKDITHFQLKLTNELRIDKQRSHIRFGKLCSDCQRHEEIYGGRGPWTTWGSKQGSMVYDVSEPIADGFFRSDISFGPPNFMTPWVVIGSETRAKLAASKLTGVHARPAYGIEPGVEYVDDRFIHPHAKKRQKIAGAKSLPPAVPIEAPILRQKRRRKRD